MIKLINNERFCFTFSWLNWKNIPYQLQDREDARERRDKIGEWKAFTAVPDCLMSFFLRTSNCLIIDLKKNKQQNKNEIH